MEQSLNSTSFLPYPLCFLYSSFSNLQEVKLVIELMKLIKQKSTQISFNQIGIITPYNAQKRRILKELDKIFGENR